MEFTKLKKTHDGLFLNKYLSTQQNALRTLKRDFISILEFDSSVLEYSIKSDGVLNIKNNFSDPFLPDFEVVFTDDAIEKLGSISMLVSVMLQSKLKKFKNSFSLNHSLTPKFSNSNGNCFKIITEEQIRTPYLHNAKFLLRYKNYSQYNNEDYDLLTNVINKLNHTCPLELTLIAAKDMKKRAELIYLLWHLIANELVSCDLTSVLTMESEIWPSKIV